MIRTGLVLGVLVVLGLGGVAHAQGYPPGPPPPGYGGGYGQPPPPPEMGRFGLMFGAALGPGYMAVSCDGCDEDSLGGIGGEAHIGWMLTPRLALLGDFWGTWHFTGEFTMEHIINTFAVQFWLGRIFWIKGGLGLGVVRFHYDDFLTVESELGFSVLGAGGVELISAPRFALDVQARLGATGFDGGSVGSFGLFLGLNWY